MMSLVGLLHRSGVHGRRVERLAARIAELLPPSARVVDVGSGDGLLAARLLRLRPDITVRGFDVLPRSSTHISVELFDGMHLPLADASCDVALLVDVLHHTDEPRVLLRECARIARHAVIVKDHLREGFAALPTLRFMDWVGNAPHGVRLPYHYLTRDEWRELLASERLTATRWDERIGLYPGVADRVFGRRLHVLAKIGR